MDTIVLKNKYIINMMWMFFEKMTTSVGVLFINIYTFRYLGPDKIGIITYVIAISSLLVPISELGCKTLIFDKTISNENKGRKLINYTNNIRIIIFTLLASFAYIYIYNDVGSSFETLFIFSFIVLSDFFKVIDVYIPYFNAILKSKINTIGSQFGIFLSQALRLILINIGAAYYYFTIPYLILTLVPYIFRAFYYKKRQAEVPLNTSKKIKIKYVDFYIKAGLPLAISEFSIVLYVKISQIFLGNYTNSHDVGIYSAASVLGQAWVFIPITMMTVLFSRVFKDTKTKKEGLAFIYFISILVSAIILIVLNIYSTEFVALLYGTKFLESASVLPILSIASFFAVLGTISYRVIIHFGGYGFLMKKMLLMAIINILLSYFLIKEFGVIGAAYSILITEILSSTFFNFFYKKSIIFNIMCKIPFSLFYFKKVF